MARNVVLLCLDSVRKDYFDRFAGRLTDRADLTYGGMRAASSWSSPSHASMFTGELPSVHGVHADNNDFLGLDRDDALTGDLPEHRAVGVSANVFASSKFGFDRLFDEFHEVSTGRRLVGGLDANEFFLESDHGGPRVAFEYLIACARSDRPLRSLANGVLAGVNVASRDAPVPKLLDDGAATMSRTIRRCVAEGPEPVFLFANYTDVHIPLRPIRGFDRELHSVANDWSTDESDVWEVVEDVDGHEEYLDNFRALYGAAVDYLDRRIVSLIDRLERETDHETTVVVTADHGENLGYESDERLVGHKSSLSEALLHVPFVVVNPPDGYPETVPGYASHLDLRALLRAMARDEVVDVERDRVPAEIVGMSPGPDPPDRYDYWDRAMRCVYEGDRKVVWDSLGEVTGYHLDPDRPCWQEPIDGDVEVPPWADELFPVAIDEYKRNQASVDATEDVDEVTRRRLEDLGYM